MYTVGTVSALGTSFRLDSIVKSFSQSEPGRQRELVSFEYGSFVFFYTTPDKSATETVLPKQEFFLSNGDQNVFLA